MALEQVEYWYNASARIWYAVRRLPDGDKKIAYAKTKPEIKAAIKDRGFKPVPAWTF